MVNWNRTKVSQRILPYDNTSDWEKSSPGVFQKLTCPEKSPERHKINMEYKSRPKVPLWPTGRVYLKHASSLADTPRTNMINLTLKTSYFPAQMVLYPFTAMSSSARLWHKKSSCIYLYKNLISKCMCVCMHYFSWQIYPEFQGLCPEWL